MNEEKPKLTFFGSPFFAEVILDHLIRSGFVPKTAVSNPDRPVGRKKTMAPPAVKQRILSYDPAIKENIRILQPEKLEPSSDLSADLFIVAAYSKIIPKDILDIPRLGVIGVHPSLLPKYRGAAPIQGVILNGEEITGTTIFLMDEKMDHGPIISQREIRIQNDTYHSLEKKLADLSAELLAEILPAFISGNIKPVSQDHEKATFTKKIGTEDAFIDPETLKMAETEGGEPAKKADRMIRALNPEPGTWTLKENGKRMKILEAELDDGKLKLKRVQIEGKREMLLF